MNMMMARPATIKANTGKAHQLALVRAACRYIDQLDGERLTLSSLAAAVNASPWHLQRLFKRIVGVSPREYADAKRADRFRAVLRDGESIAGATYDAGYGSSSRVYERAHLQLGMTPASYAKGGEGARINYTVVPSQLGFLLVAATARGVCFVSLGDSEGALEGILRQEFPSADIVRDDAAIAPALETLLAYLEGQTPHIDLPLDVRATAFQRRVWQELLAIPAGETRSYADIAAAIGNPKSQRAVGRACASNPVALVVPCHRALREDGGLGGYRWGPERKEALLNHELEMVDA